MKNNPFAVHRTRGVILKPFNEPHHGWKDARLTAMILMRSQHNRSGCEEDTVRPDWMLTIVRPTQSIANQSNKSWVKFHWAMFLFMSPLLSSSRSLLFVHRKRQLITLMPSLEIWIHVDGDWVNRKNGESNLGRVRIANGYLRKRLRNFTN